MDTPKPATTSTDTPHGSNDDNPASRSNAATARSFAALLAAGLTVVVIPARQISALRTRYSSAGNKDDRFDAYLLADVLRTDRARLTELTVDTDATVGLRMLVRARADLVKARVDAHNQLRAHLQLAHPGTVGLFHALDSKISLAFLTRFPTPRHAAWLSDKRLAGWLHAAHYTRANTRTPAELLKHLRDATAGHPDGPASDAGEVITLEFVTLLRSLRERITTIETRIEQALRSHVEAPVVHQPAPLWHRPGRDPARRDRGRPRPVPHRRCPGRRGRDLPLHPRLGTVARRGVPPRLQPPPLPSPRRLRRRHPPRPPLGPRHLHPRPGPRAKPRPRRAGPGPRLAPDHLALLARPHLLRPGTPPCRARGP